MANIIYKYPNSKVHINILDLYADNSIPKRKLLNLEQRVNVVKQHDKGVSCRAIAKSLDVGKTQVQGIINDRAKIMNLWDNGAISGVKFRKTVNHEVKSKM